MTRLPKIKNPKVFAARIQDLASRPRARVSAVRVRVVHYGELLEIYRDFHKSSSESCERSFIWPHIIRIPGSYIGSVVFFFSMMSLGRIQVWMDTHDDRKIKPTVQETHPGACQNRSRTTDKLIAVTYGTKLLPRRLSHPTSHSLINGPSRECGNGVAMRKIVKTATHTHTR